MLFKTQSELLKALQLKIDTQNNIILKSSHKCQDIVATAISRNGQDEELVGGASRDRQLEMKQYNGTVHQDGTGERVFTYYWKLNGVKLAGGEWMRSDNFYVTEGGYCMYLTLLTTQDGETVYVQVGLTRGKFDEALLWPFRLKHQISVLNQMPLSLQRGFSWKPDDIQSAIWEPSVVCSNHHWQKPSLGSDNHQCVGIRISRHQLLHPRYFLLDNTLIIKLTVYLE